MFRGPRDYCRLDLKQYGGHKDEVNYTNTRVDRYEVLCVEWGGVFMWKAVRW